MRLCFSLSFVLAFAGCRTAESAALPASAAPAAAMPEPANTWLFASNERGASGPDVDVQVKQSEAGRFVLTASAGGKSRTIEFDLKVLLDFHIVSRGAPGVNGASCEAGARGEDGAPCMHGGDGSPGGHGGSGGRGGRGGTLTIMMTCGAATCPAALVNAMEVNAVSQGGEGGGGGPGGAGGHAGHGGLGQQTSSTGLYAPAVIQGCESGLEGNYGEEGLRGADGEKGEAGLRRIR